MRTKYLYLAFLLISLGCSNFSKNFESIFDNKSAKTNLNKNLDKNNYCAEPSSNQLISEDENIQKLHNQLRKNFFEKKNLSFIDKIISLMLVEMRRRPDVLTPYSRLQIYLKIKGKNYYFDFSPKDISDQSTMPVLMALDYLNLKFNNGKSLNLIAGRLDEFQSSNNVVSFEFENFLKNNQKEIKKNETYTNLFFKGDDVITKYDTFESLTFKSIIEKFYKTKNNNLNLYANIERPFFNIQLNNQDLTELKDKKGSIECNVNLNINEKIQFSNEEYDQTMSFPVGMSESGNTFLAVSTSRIVHPLSNSIDYSLFFKQQAPHSSSPMCIFKKNNQNIILFSIDGVNPIQHLQHLISYDIGHVENIENLNELLNFSRHLFLNMPDRILYESKRGRKSQLDLFLSMNFPIYHIESLGNILGHTEFLDQSHYLESFIIDSRNSSKLWCQK